MSMPLMSMPLTRLPRICLPLTCLWRFQRTFFCTFGTNGGSLHRLSPTTSVYTCAAAGVHRAVDPIVTTADADAADPSDAGLH